MKSFLKKLAFKLVSIEPVWKLIAKFLIYPSQVLRAYRNLHVSEEIIRKNQILAASLSRRVVLSGPFKGLQYGSLEAHCSALHPKLLGTYEMELSDVIENCISDGFTELVDVGAAEGYYAVGLAHRMPKLKVTAFEQEEDARRELVAFAAQNGVADRIDIRARCEPEDMMLLENIRALMIVDCEGYEDILLDDRLISKLTNWDFIIETHDGIRPGVTKRLEERFSKTHATRRIPAINDLDRIDSVKLPALEGLSREEQTRLVSEGRQHATVCWLYCASKTAEFTDIN